MSSNTNTTGRWTTADCVVIASGTLSRVGILRGGSGSSQRKLVGTDPQTGEAMLTVACRVTHWEDVTAELELVYFVGGCEMTSHVTLTTTTLPKGGLRWWFCCPRCGRRSGKLYLPPGLVTFDCRLCHRLTYETCRESHRLDRLVREVARELVAGSE